MATIKFVQAQKFSLSGSGSSIGDTTITLQSMMGINGDLITTTNIGVKAFGTLEPGNGAQEEQISFTGVTQNANGTATLSGVKSVIFVSPYTATSGLSKTHAGGSTFILSNDAGFYGQILDYIDAAIVSGGVPATTAVPGITALSTTPASANFPIAVGTNDPRVPTADPNILYSPLGITPGLLVPYTAVSGTPTGWLSANGQAVSRTTYAPLFSILSTSFGAGNGTTTFNVPTSVREFGWFFDSVASNNLPGASASISWSHTIGSANNSVLFVSVYRFSATVSSATYAGVSMTLLTTTALNGSSSKNVDIYYLLNPTVGTNTVSITFSGSINSSGTSFSYLNISQSGNPFASTVSTGSATNIALGLTPSGPTDLVFGVWYSDTGNTTVPVVSNSVLRSYFVTGSGGGSYVVAELFKGVAASTGTFGASANMAAVLVAFKVAISGTKIDLIKT